MKYHKVLINSIIILLIVLLSGCQNSQTSRITINKESVQEVLSIVNNKVEQYEIFNLDKFQVAFINFIMIRKMEKKLNK